MRLLVVLNENPAGSHIDVHLTLAQLKQEGKLEDSVVIPWLALVRQGQRSQDIETSILTIAREFQPTAILWSHTSTLPIKKATVAALRTLASQPTLGYWEGDAYEKPFKPMPAEAAKLAANCDVVFCQSFGATTDTFRKAGCQDIRYTPGTTDPWRFGNLRSSPAQIEYDVVLIGNRVTSRIPWHTMPGAKWRKELVDVFSKKLGGRFACYGAGWSGPNAKGPIPFEKQAEVYHKSRLALGVNNLHGMYSFSNRLPVAMSVGVPVIYNYEQGLEEVFPADSGVFFYRDTEECVGLVFDLLQKKQSELDRMGAAAFAFAMGKLSIVHIYEYMMAVMGSCRQQRFNPEMNHDVRSYWLPEIRSTVWR